ncbi:TPA: hypothetical protein QDA96_002029 [Burkholderia vietnamiensis]|uniref:hypothetical protein n=1 Tax=Burkholderia TaxID=32008 RepID=UPI0014170767|nr:MULTISPECIES: hypothetical protein [Burkholderia]MBR8012722.1 hypothetical protein [Burkholderia vietnamiensis]HDR8919217.1 hypothetical protein [Burkholderia vietnamiensis]HDR8977329.1 hypothetical protein [Burkholderia vietnamiensis]HDR9041369.1 hypothetical protein [Burkholderia vietnamiensis]HDR9198480.1 hypothetical protein [Burkholderia vietnamiensis]
MEPKIQNALYEMFCNVTVQMSAHALESQRAQDGIKDVLLGTAQLYEALRERHAGVRRAGL